MKIKNLIIATMVLFASKAWSQKSNSIENVDPLVVTGQVKPFSLGAGQAAQVEIKLSLPKGYHAYEDQLYFEIQSPPGFRKGVVKLEPLSEWFDKFSKKNRKGIENQATLTADIEAPIDIQNEAKTMVINLHYQACSESFCLFPTTKKFELPFNLAGPKKSMIPLNLPVSESIKSFSDSSRLEKLLESNILLALLFVYFAGVLTSFTPCIFPMIPITLAILGHHQAHRRRSTNFLFSMVYVFGIASTYSILGIFAATTGGLFGASLGNPYILSGMCFLMLSMSLSMFGAFEVQIPLFISNRLNHKKSEGLPGAYLMGLVAGVVASPCVGPVLVSILALAAASNNKFIGFIMLFLYALGLGTLFIILGLSYNLTKKLPRSGPWMDTIKFAMGSFMLIAFFYYLHLLVPKQIFDGLLGAGLILLGGAHYHGHLQAQTKIKNMANALMLSLIVMGSVQIVGAFWDIGTSLENISSNNAKQATPCAPNSETWSDYSDIKLAEARDSKKPVIIDFWADWCEACHELEEKTFQDGNVKTELNDFTLLKFNATHSSPELDRLTKIYKIKGLPTLIFIDRNGIWLESDTLSQYEPAKEFIKRLRQAKQK